MSNEIETMKKKSKRTLTPKLRFPEFRDKPEWESESLGRLFINRQEKGFPNLPLLSVTDERGIIPQEETNRKDNSSSDKSKYLRVVPGDITYNTMRMWEGRSAYVDREGLVSPAYTVCQPQKGRHGKFFSYYFKTASLIEQFRKYSQGLVKDTLNLKYDGFACISVPSPPFAEQQKISDCMSSLDGLIAAEGQELAALRDHKKGLMQQLFPQPGQTQPRLRFPEFRDKGEWKEEKLSRHIKLVSGVHLSPSDYSDHGQIPYFTGPSDFTNAESHISKWTAQTDNKGVAHDILITVKGSGVGELWYLELPQAALGRQLMAVRPLNGIARFYFQLLLSKRRLFEDLAMGNLIPGLSRGDILNLKTPLPREEEQQKIADCLSSLDTRIAAQTAKIETLKQHKRGLMQQLFPSPEVS